MGVGGASKKDLREEKGVSGSSKQPSNREVTMGVGGAGVEGGT